MELTEDDRDLLRKAKAASAIIDTEAWRAYRAVLESQVKTRENILFGITPSEEAPMATLLRMEHIKGARLGLLLAIETASLIIDDVKKIAAEDQEDD